jgi:hypothetical protein
MESLTKTISSLETRRAELVRELSGIDEQLTAVAAVLKQGSTAKVASTAETKSKRAAVRAGGRKMARRSWFARDEAGKLLRRAAKSATSAADLVREVAELKGYSKTLSTDDMRRFQGAAFMAINQAVRNGLLRRRKDGALQAA